jgi:hypothetical protein
LKIAFYDRFHMSLREPKNKFLGLFAAFLMVAGGLQLRAEEAAEDPWPHWLNIYTYAGSGGFSAVEILKFSSQEKENYSGGRPVLCRLPGWEQLPVKGWLRDPQTGQSVGYALHVVEENQFLALTGADAGQVQAIRSQLMATNPTVLYAELPNTGGRVLPGTLKAFLTQIAQKWVGGLEFIESTFEPPVWRTAPIKSEIKRMTVEQWNAKALEGGE